MAIDYGYEICNNKKLVLSANATRKLLIIKMNQLMNTKKFTSNYTISANNIYLT